MKRLQNRAKYLFEKKSAPFFLSRAQTHHSFISNSRFLQDSTRFVSLEECVGFSIFDIVSFLLKFTFFLQQKTWTL